MAEKPDNKAPVPVELFFDARDSGYLFKLQNRFVKLKKSDLQMHLKTLGYSEIEWVKSGRGMLRQTDWILWDAMTNRLVDYAGALAGHRVGVFKDGSGQSFLVTQEARGVFDDIPKKISEPEFFSAFVAELLPDDQSSRLCFWLSMALQSLRRGDFRPGQVLVLAGGPACGKSLLQCIITEILGGRAANPFRYMMQETQFNNDLVGAEHWCIEDPPTTTDIRSRRIFGANLKNCCFNRDFPVHPKGKDAQNLPIFRRISISVNDETENIAVIPPLEGSINDKMLILKCDKVRNAFAQFRGKDGTPQLIGNDDLKRDGELDRKALWSKVMAEIPTIRAWLLKAFKTVPREWREDRCGMTWWHHPDLVAELSSLAPEHRLLQLIDYVYFEEDTDGVSVTLTDRKAFDLEKEITNKAPSQAAAINRMMNWAGNYLGKLLKAKNPRISKRELHGTTLWTIKPPVKHED